MDGLITWGPWGLFLAAFLAATVLPLSSEVVLSTLLLSGQSPLLLIAVATVGNVLGSVLNYMLGSWLSQRAMPRWRRLSPKQIASAQERFAQYGTASLLLAWVPVIGDPLTVVAGMLRVRWWKFLLLVTLGKGLRYLVVTYLVLQAV